MFMFLITILLGSSGKVRSAQYSGLSALLDNLRPEIDSLLLTEKLESNVTFLNQRISFPILYTFPPGIKCFKVTTDDSHFARVVVKTLYKHVGTPSFLNKPDDDEDKSCLGNIVVASNLSTLVKIEGKVKRDSKFRMVCMVETSSQDEIEDVLENELYRFGDSEFTLFSWETTEVFYRVGQPIRAPEKIVIDENFLTLSFTTWQLNNVITENFYGRTIRISTYDCDWNSRVGPIHPNGSTGSDAALIKEIAAKINLTLKFVKPAPGVLLSKFVNGTWVGGLYENIATGKADLVVCASWLESSKYKGGLQLSVPIIPICQSYLVRSPKQLNSLFLVFLPFNYATWLLIAGSQIAFSVFVRSFTEFMKSIGFHWSKIERYRSLSYVTFKIYGMLVNGCWPAPKDKLGPIRHLFTWWVVFCVLISCGYSSTLISQVTKPDFTKKPKTVADLVKGGYFWMTEFQFPSERLWDLADPYYKAWANDRYKRVEFDEKLSLLYNDPKSTIIGMKIDGDSLFGPFFNELPSNLTDEFEAMDSCLASVFHVIAHRSGSPFIDAVDYYITRMQESGLVGYYMRQALHSRLMPRPVQLNSDAKKICRGDCQPRALVLNEMRGIFFCLLVGWFVASVAFIGEVIWTKRSS